MSRPRRNVALNFDEGADDVIDDPDAPPSRRRRKPPPKPEPCPCGTGLPKVKCSPKHVRESSTFRAGHRNKQGELVVPDIKSHRFIGFDLETKKRKQRDLDINEDQGFDDPILCGVYVSEERQRIFRNKTRRKVAIDPARQAYERGGCVREFLEEYLVPEYAYDAQNGIPWIFVAHNGAGFDFVHLVLALSRMRDRFKFEPIVNGSRVISITVIQKIGKKTYKWRFFDTGLPVTLAKLGNIVDPTGEKELTKLIETDLNMPEGDPRWDGYVMRDCKIVAVVMAMFQKIVNDLGGEWKQTLPGTIVDIFRRHLASLIEEGEEVRIQCNRHFKSCPDICKRCWQVRCWKTCQNRTPRDEEIAEWKWDASIQAHIGKCEWSPDGCAHFFVRRGFFGGRTEMFRQNYCNEFYDPIKEEYNPPAFVTFKDPATGKDVTVPYRSPFRVFDINSSYPASMLFPMPIGRMTCYVGKRMFDKVWERVLAGKERRAGFIECTVEVPDMPYPPLPVRADGKIKFPTGFLQGVWTSIELHEAVKLGVKIRSVNRHIWIGTRAVFRPVIMSLWSKRKEAIALDKLDKAGGHAGYAEIMKLLMNSFFGKWGMGEYREEFLIADDEEGLPDGVIPDKNMRDARRTKHVIADYINPAIAAWITSLSRIRLLHVFIDVVRLLGWVWYTDTDSAHCNVEVANQNLDLGGLKREYDENDIVFCRYDTAKVYELVMAGPCPKGCSHRVKDKSSPHFDKPCGKKLHAIIKSKGIQDADQQKLHTLRRYSEIHAESVVEQKRARTAQTKTERQEARQRQEELIEIAKQYRLVQRRTPKFRAVFKNGFDVYETNYESYKSMTMRYDKRELDRLTGLTKPERIGLHQVVKEKRAKVTPNLKRWDAMSVSVADKEAEWAAGRTRLAVP